MKRMLLAVAVATLMVGMSGLTASAGPIISSGSAPAAYEIEARGRNGNTGFEGVLFTPGDPSPGNDNTQLNPSGAPVWAYNQFYSFLFSYTASTGTAVWSIDFNRDGDYEDTEESATSVSPTLAGKSFKYVNLFGQGNGTVDVQVNTYAINGVSFVPPILTTAGAAPDSFNVLAEDSSGLFGDIQATGTFTFTGSGGQERPRLWIQLGTAQNVPVSVPDTGATLALLGVALAGLGALRRKLS